MRPFAVVFAVAKGTSPRYFALTGGCQRRIGVHRTAVSGVDLEVKVVGPAEGVAGVAYIANDRAALDPGAGGEAGGSSVEVGVVVAGSTALESDGDPA